MTRQETKRKSTESSHHVSTQTPSDREEKRQRLAEQVETLNHSDGVDPTDETIIPPPPLEPPPPPPPSPPLEPPPPPLPNTTEEDDIALLEAMGLPVSFDSTKGKPVPGNNNVGAANIKRKRVYRQYMNRPGGFNRPLDPVP